MSRGRELRRKREAGEGRGRGLGGERKLTCLPDCALLLSSFTSLSKLSGKGADPNHMDKFGSCALLDAIRGNQKEVTAYLVTHGAGTSYGWISVPE